MDVYDEVDRRENDAGKTLILLPLTITVLPSLPLSLFLQLFPSSKLLLRRQLPRPRPKLAAHAATGHLAALPVRVESFPALATRGGEGGGCWFSQRLSMAGEQKERLGPLFPLLFPLISLSFSLSLTHTLSLSLHSYTTCNGNKTDVWDFPTSEHMCTRNTDTYTHTHMDRQKTHVYFQWRPMLSRWSRNNGMVPSTLSTMSQRQRS